MMIKVNGEYLEFDGEIEIDRKAKLFQDIETVDGDFSYEFELRLTSHNVRVLGFPFPDNKSKLVYQRIPAEVLNANGESASGPGDLRIERIVRDIAYCSFWSGNSNWFAMLTGNMTQLELSAYDVDQTEANIVSSWYSTSGIVFPLIDTGSLSRRSYQNLLIEDFSPGFYLKDMFSEVFKSVGIKLQGELIEDDIFNSVIVFSNTRSKNQIDIRSAYVSGPGNIVGSGTIEHVIFDDDSTYPYFNGSNTNFNIALSRYTADVGMNLKIDFTATNVINFTTFLLYVNGVQRKIIAKGNGIGNIIVRLNPGDYVEIYAEEVSGIFIGGYGSATVRFTPTYLFKSFGNASVPNWNKIDFVSAILTLFNTITKYDPYTKTLTINLFDKIKYKSPIDLSEYITIEETDYTEFISNYGKRNVLTYQEGEEIEDKREYNIGTFIEYGAGEVTSNNEFLEEEVTVVDSPFTAPISYKNAAIGMSTERINFTELLDNGEADIVDVDDDGGVARIEVNNISLFSVGTLVRIEDSIDDYNGEWLIIEIGSNYFKALGLRYVSSTSLGKAVSLIHGFTDSEDVFLMINVPIKPIGYFSPIIDLYINFTPYNEISIAYFNLINLGTQLNLEYKQGLSFGSIQSTLSYQRSLIDTYWQSFKRILQDPVMLKFIAYIPAHVYEQLDFLSPVYIKTLESVNLYYLNRISGYKGSHMPCEGELIKLP